MGMVDHIIRVAGSSGWACVSQKEVAESQGRVSGHMWDWSRWKHLDDDGGKSYWLCCGTGWAYGLGPWYRRVLLR